MLPTMQGLVEDAMYMPHLTRGEASLQSYEHRRTAVTHLEKSNQQKSPGVFEKPARPVFYFKNIV